MQAVHKGMQIFIVGRDISPSGVDSFIACKGTEKTPYTFFVPVSDVEVA